MHYPEDGGDMIIREGTTILNALYLTREDIEGLNGKQWGSEMGGKYIESVGYE